MPKGAIIKDNTIKVGFCVAYDWPLLAFSLPRIYNEADSIWLSIDESQKSWSNKAFTWNERQFNELISALDVSGKINIYRDNFHLPDLTAAENEVRQRKKLSEKMGEGGWHIQLDCDEYFLNFGGFVKYLKDLPAQKRRFNVSCQFVTVFKEVEGGFLYVYPENHRQFEFFQIASRTPCFQHGRRNGYFNVHTTSLIVHQSWARSENEIAQKLSNWGHVNDFDINGYLQFWKSVTVENFREIHNFHPITPSAWASLELIRAEGVVDLIEKFTASPFPTLNLWSKFLINSLVWAKLRRSWMEICSRIFQKN